jgi:hypothetical protein
MSFATPLHRTLLIALASLALCAPAAVARPADLRAEAPTSSLSGTTKDQTSAEAIPGRVLRRSFDPFPNPVPRLEAAVAQERSYSTYGTPAPLASSTDRGPRDNGAGISWLGFGLALLGALIAGLAAGPALQRRSTRIRRAATSSQAARTPPEPGPTV